MEVMASIRNYIVLSCSRCFGDSVGGTVGAYEIVLQRRSRRILIEAGTKYSSICPRCFGD